MRTVVQACLIVLTLTSFAAAQVKYEYAEFQIIRIGAGPEAGQPWNVVGVQVHFRTADTSYRTATASEPVDQAYERVIGRRWEGEWPPDYERAHLKFLNALGEQGWQVIHVGDMYLLQRQRN